ncbi:hypothetical protein [Herbihabitans rhizosphaerae]|uniref:hypothetical protein n=1 Tax=Herbihabitans rhizosphaerae TaxID=1872711 RepID=UPI00102B4CB4|nr:hypothetical protein [Herbihabitans rhizosphaerae]
MTKPDDAIIEQRLYDAVDRWGAAGPAELVDTACDALIAGLDSPALRDLAGASARDPYWEIRELVDQMLAELGIPQPGTILPGFVVAAGGGVARRPGVDSLRLDVAPAPSEVGGFQVLISVNDEEMTAAAAGLGMDPYDILIPANRLIAGNEPHTVPIARCGCGVYGCGSTDIRITRDGDRVHWDWLIEVPMRRGVTFPADRYDDEVARVAADHSWETPDRTAGRLVLTGVDHERLRDNGLHVDWAANDHRNAEVFRVVLRSDDSQVFVDTPWRGRAPEELAREVCKTLARAPRE